MEGEERMPSPSHANVTVSWRFGDNLVSKPASDKLEVMNGAPATEAGLIEA
jgi:hypothetical protein